MHCRLVGLKAPRSAIHGRAVLPCGSCAGLVKQTCPRLPSPCHLTGLGVQEKRSEVLWQALERAIPDVRERVNFKLVSLATSKSIDQCHAQCTGLPAAVGVGIRWPAAGARPADGVPCLRMCCNVRRLRGMPALWLWSSEGEC